MLVLNIISKVVNALDPPYIGRRAASGLPTLIQEQAFDLKSLLRHLIPLYLLQAPRKRVVQLGIEHLPVPSTMQAPNDLQAYFHWAHCAYDS